MPLTPTDDVRIKGYMPLTPPKFFKQSLPLTKEAEKTVVTGRREIQNIIEKKDGRLLIIAGPCSIHDEQAAMEYAKRLVSLREKIKDVFCVVMRVYFEKPRTTVGWKGLINDPHQDGTYDIQAGLQKARSLLIHIAELGLPAGTEMLEPITPQYIADLVCWSAVGARTTESQTHREMASGLSMPVGFKNGTDGSTMTAINALVAAKAPQTFLGIDQDGQTCVVKTNGNPWGHIVLRGGKRPNYDPISIEETRLMLIGKKLPESVMIDCSHANSHKKFQGQAIVWKNVVDQHINGSDAVIGLMLESNIHEGNQKYTGNPETLKYGVSITDECISWETTEKLLLDSVDKIRSNLRGDIR